ncbi:hypothetical protein D8B30_25050 [Verminephrobacter eiseniae]|nr:hypothetical protein [Verminephrobacter eiseniae]
MASDATPRCASMASADRQMIGDATLGPWAAEAVKNDMARPTAPLPVRGTSQEHRHKPGAHHGPQPSANQLRRRRGAHHAHAAGNPQCVQR